MSGSHPQWIIDTMGCRKTGMKKNPASFSSVLAVSSTRFSQPNHLPKTATKLHAASKNNPGRKILRTKMVTKKRRTTKTLNTGVPIFWGGPGTRRFIRILIGFGCVSVEVLSRISAMATHPTQHYQSHGCGTFLISLEVVQSKEKILTTTLEGWHEMNRLVKGTLLW